MLLKSAVIGKVSSLNWLTESKSYIDERSFHGSLKLLLPVNPWVITLRLQGLSMSSEHVKALFGSELLSNLFSKDDIDSIFVNGSRFKLQLEPQNTDLPSAVVEATLFEKSEDGRGLVLAFQFHNVDKDLEELMSSLG